MYVNMPYTISVGKLPYISRMQELATILARTAYGSTNQISVNTWQCSSPPGWVGRGETDHREALAMLPLWDALFGLGGKSTHCEKPCKWHINIL